MQSTVPPLQFSVSRGSVGPETLTSSPTFAMLTRRMFEADTCANSGVASDAGSGVADGSSVGTDAVDMRAGSGSVTGAFLGLVFCLLQDHFGFVSTSEGSLFDAYPVDIRYMDLVLIFITVMAVSTLVSYMASRLNIRGINKRGALESN